MKIGIICHPSIGGSGLVATQLGIGLASRGHEVHFISRAMPFKLPKKHENIHFHAVEPISYPLFNDSLYTFALTSKIIEVAEQYEIDIMHAHYSIPHSLCNCLASEISKHHFKTITTIHGTDTKIVGQDKPLYPLNKFSLDRSDALTTVSNYQKKHTKKYFKIEKEIEVIYNFIDTDVFKPSLASKKIRRSMAKDSEKIIMHISNFREPKNTRGVIKTFFKTIGRVDARLVLVGDGEMMDEIKELCRKLDIYDRVVFMGKISHIETIIANADCVLQPSYTESFGMVALEAMACQVPVVASNIDGIPEVVEHKITGFTTKPDNHQKMADYIVKVLFDDATKRRVVDNAYEMLKDRFSWETQIDKYIKCYNKCLKKGIK